MAWLPRPQADRGGLEMHLVKMGEGKLAPPPLPYGEDEARRNNYRREAGHENFPGCSSTCFSPPTSISFSADICSVLFVFLLLFAYVL